MVKYFGAVLLAAMFAVPSFAQDYAQFELTFGYANVGVKNLLPVLPSIQGHKSGFATHQTINLSSLFAIENYLGYYGLGKEPSLGGVRLITEAFGGRFSYRSAGPVIYGTAGLGASFLQLSDQGVSSGNTFTVRYGGGVDIPINDSISWKVELARTGFHFDGWKTGTNLSTGIVLKIAE